MLLSVPEAVEKVRMAGSGRGVSGSNGPFVVGLSDVTRAGQLLCSACWRMSAALPLYITPAVAPAVAHGGRSLWATWLEDTERAAVLDLVDSRL